MAALSLRPGLLHAAGNVNVAAVAQIILNRILAANEKPLPVSDIAEICGISLENTREALQTLSELGLIFTTGSLSSATELRPMSLRMTVGVEAETTLFTTNGMTSDGLPAVLAGPVYYNGGAYTGRIAERSGEFQLIIERMWHGENPHLAFEQVYDSESEARQGALDYFAEDNSDETRTTFVYKGLAAEATLGNRVHDGETIILLDLIADKETLVTFTGESEDDVRKQLRTWHEAVCLAWARDVQNAAEVGGKPNGRQRRAK